MEQVQTLKKELGLLDVFCIASGAMISSGLFILPGVAFSKTGPSLFLSYLLAAFLALPAMFSKAELTTAMPRAGGDYFFITRSMGYAVGSIAGAASWFSLSLKSAFALVGMSAYVALITNIPITSAAVLFCLFFVLLNIIGVREATLFQRFLVLGILIISLFYISRGFASIHINKFVPFMPNGAGPIFATTGFVFVSYGGLTKIASVAEEVRNPGKNIPLGMILSLIVAGVLYTLAVFVTTGVLEPGKFQSSLTPISDAAELIAGNTGGIIMALAAIFAFVSTANAGVMSASRYPMAMSRDGVLPKFFKKVNMRFGTPHYAVLFTGGFMILAITCLRLEMLVKVASTFLIMLFIFANLAVVVMRESRIQNYQPKFRSPFYPWMQVVGVISGIFLIFEMGTASYSIIGIFILVGLLWYLIYVRQKAREEFALIHVIERITAKELTSNYLETELKGIIKERDDIVEDRFDKLIKNGRILDLKGSFTMKQFFGLAADALASELHTDSKALSKLLLKREEESSTVLRPGLAIPHIVVEGDGKFKILLARCKKGIVFPSSKSKVHIVFVLAGSRDERNFHLRALAAIAEIVQSAGFDKNWLRARNLNELRDIILLAERKRFQEGK